MQYNLGNDAGSAIYTTRRCVVGIRNSSPYTILERFLDGATPEEIVLRYPALELAAVYEVIAYYLRHQTAMTNYLEQAAHEQLNLRSFNETKHNPVGIRERLLNRQK